MTRLVLLRVHPLLAVLLAIAATAACAPSSTDLLRPHGIAGLDAEGRAASREQVERAVKLGASRKGWTITDEEPGAVYAIGRGGGHEAKVRIDYDASGWTIQYVSSSPGLKYDPDYRGREIIHRRYNFWVTRLNSTIQSILQDQQMSGLR